MVGELADRVATDNGAVLIADYGEKTIGDRLTLRV